jgi:dynein heavy chain
MFSFWIKHKIKDILESWVKVQSGWMYLESIFASDDICSQMPIESDLFDQVDEYWRNIMKNSVLNSKVLVVTSRLDMLEKLKSCESKLESIHKGLNEYLEKKRLFFPRSVFHN